MLNDVRYALRVLRKGFGFAVVAALTMALGIGANTAIFTVVNALLLRPLPYENSDRLVTLWGSNPKRGLRYGSYSLMRLDQLRSENRSFSSVAGFCGESFNLTGTDQPEQLQAARVSSSFLATLGVRPILGRDFLADEDRDGGKLVVLLGHGLWQRRFGGNPNIVGSAITLDSASYTVIGVLPPGLDQPQPDLDLLATNLAGFSRFTRDQIRAGGGYIGSIARLKPGVTLSQAQAEMDVLTRRYIQDFSGKVDADPDGRMLVESLQDTLVGNIRPALLVLCAAVGLVLLIACANVASLLLARATARSKEFAVRVALGATRFDLIRQLLAESLVLSVVSGALGLLAAMWGTGLLAHITQINLPRVREIHVDGQTLAFTFAISILTGVLFGLIPSLQSSQPDLNAVLRESSRGTSGSTRRNRTRSVLVIGQVALSIVLLISAGLLIRSFMALEHVDPGFEPRHVLTMQVALPSAKYPTDSKKNAFFRDALAKIESIPGVESASAALRPPMTGLILVPALRDGDARVPLAKRPMAYWQSITPDYFRAMQIRLLRGRFFNEHDNEKGAGVAIVDETMAHRYWPNENPIGKRLIVSRSEMNVEVVGVVADIKSAGLDSAREAELYSPYDQRSWPAMSIVVKTVGDPLAMSNAVRKRIQEVDHDLPVTGVRTLESIVAESVGQRQLTLWLLGAFAALALVLAGVGIYGLLAYAVEQRRQEMGIRQALGAQQSDILALVMRQGLGLTLAGVALGLLASIAATRALSSLLFHVSPTDPAIFAGVAAVFLAVAALASYMPARRALKVDPLAAMRE